VKRLIQYPLEDGGTIWVEVEEPLQEGSLVPAATPREMIVKASETLEAALDKVKPAIRGIVGRLRDLGDPPDEFAVEFGLKLNAEAGAILASAGAEANLVLTLTWKRERKSDRWRRVGRRRRASTLYTLYHGQ